jgi:hypothetical protein
VGYAAHPIAACPSSDRLASHISSSQKEHSLFGRKISSKGILDKSS